MFCNYATKVAIHLKSKMLVSFAARANLAIIIIIIILIKLHRRVQPSNTNCHRPHHQPSPCRPRPRRARLTMLSTALGTAATQLPALRARAAAAAPPPPPAPPPSPLPLASSRFSRTTIALSSNESYSALRRHRPPPPLPSTGPVGEMTPTSRSAPHGFVVPEAIAPPAAPAREHTDQARNKRESAANRQGQNMGFDVAKAYAKS